MMSYLYCGGSDCLRAPLPDLMEVSQDSRATHLVVTRVIVDLWLIMVKFAKGFELMRF